MVALWVAVAITDEARRTGGTVRALVAIPVVIVAAEVKALFLADSVADLRRQAPVVAADVAVAAVEVARADVALRVADPVAHQSDARGAAKVAVSGWADRVPIAFHVVAVLRVRRLIYDRYFDVRRRRDRGVRWVRVLGAGWWWWWCVCVCVCVQARVCVSDLVAGAVP